LETEIKHDIDFGIRYHEDFEDRFQWVDGYKIQNGHNRDNNGTQEQMLTMLLKAAVAAHYLYNLQINNFTFTPGLHTKTSVYH
jgi:Fe(3+) dicitrate transport protein